MFDAFEFPEEGEDLGVGFHDLGGEDRQQRSLIRDIITQLEYFPTPITRLRRMHFHLQSIQKLGIMVLRVALPHGYVQL